MSNHQETVVSTLTGGISAIVVGSVWSLVGDVMMALIFGFVGALGGWVFKLLLEYGKGVYLKIKEWVSLRFRR